jgi:hypothetical protein
VSDTVVVGVSVNEGVYVIEGVDVGDKLGVSVSVSVRVEVDEAVGLVVGVKVEAEVEVNLRVGVFVAVEVKVTVAAVVGVKKLGLGATNRAMIPRQYRGMVAKIMSTRIPRKRLRLDNW